MKTTARTAERPRRAKAEALRVEDETVLRALRVLKRLSEIRGEKKKNALFAEAPPVLVQIDCVKIPECPARKLRFHLPNPLVTDASEICLFVADARKGKRVDHEPTVQHYEDLLREEGITNIKTVMPVRQLRVEFDQMETKRRLLTQYDVFLADARVSGLLAHKLGATFQRKNRMPTPVRIHEGDVKRNIERALGKTTMNLHGAGGTYAMRAANGVHTEEEACRNVQAVLSQLDRRLPGGWANVRSVYLKNPLSTAVPVYVTLKNKNLVERARIEPLRSVRGFEEDELSTVLDATVRVYADGNVSVKRKRKNSDKENAAEPEETINDNTEETIRPRVDVKKQKVVKTEKAEKSEETKPKKEKLKNKVSNKTKHE